LQPRAAEARVVVQDLEHLAEDELLELRGVAARLVVDQRRDQVMEAERQRPPLERVGRDTARRAVY
jgi:hypothetical protein